MHDLSELFTLSTLVFCLMIWVLVFAERKLVSLLWKGCEKNKYWRELILPLSAPFIGGLVAAFVSQYPYPEIFESTSARVFFGVVCGLASSTVYRILKKFLKSKSGEQENPLGE